MQSALPIKGVRAAARPPGLLLDVSSLALALAVKKAQRLLISVARLAVAECRPST
jgi:hypothetical protein